MFKFLNMLWQCLKASAISIYSNGLRSILTTLGIVIGVAAVVTVVAVMNGMSSMIGNQLNDFASDMVTLTAKTSEQQRLLGQQKELNYDDYIWLKNKADFIRDISPSMQPTEFSANIEYSGKSISTQLIGTDSVYQRVVKVYPEFGRFLSPSDDQYRRRVVFLGATVLKNLNLPKDPVGHFVRLNDDWLRVIGVGERRGSLFGFDQDNYIIVPLNTLRSIYGDSISNNLTILFRPKEGVHFDAIKGQISELVRYRMGVQPGEQDTFEFITAEKMQEKFDSIVNMVLMVTSGVVGLSLFVGGIGVMNIMLVSVTERTKEIGIVKSLGATPQFIMMQFLIESLMLSILGGVVGLLIGLSAAAMFAILLPSSSALDLVPAWAIWLSFGFTTFVGVFFGLAPAIKASRLDPIDALRYE
ncbi:ABC transporter permease [Pseudoalteromonas sp. A25]|uniref:ABC transporter permease n=1 Tax=Pseudoalteromonas sp. A25 TaxID=116092 RepID=UPI0012604DFC|nr:ABC transporter permease [Pseudoalteromonas sp. A25]BBN83056.1 ABC transporter permease [Pseudoalteromonas sp. A25]